MKSSSTVSIRAIGIYLFGVFTAFLAGNYFSSFIFIVFIILLLYPVVSLLLLLLIYFNVKLFQDFSTEHPVKGQNVEYKLYISNEFLLPFPNLTIRFKSITPAQDLLMPDFRVFIPSKGMFKKIFQVNCPYRGIYTVGLEEVIVADLLHFFRFRLNVWHKTFYVYPRILPLQRFNPGIEQFEGGDKGLPESGEPDYAMFDKLKNYRPGESIKHIYWKKFAITGNPYMKEYDSTPEPGVRIYFDLRQPAETAFDTLEIEDTSVEILVTLVHYFLGHEITTSVRAPGREVYTFTGKQASDFQGFYNSTTSLLFQDTVSPARLYKADEKQHQGNINAVFFITHLLDVELFNLLQSSLQTNLRFTVIFNQSGFFHEQIEQSSDFFNELRNQGARIIIVKNSATIVEDLERGVNG